VSRVSDWLPPELHDYLVAHGTPPDPVLRVLAEETAALGDLARLQVAPEEGALLTLLTQLLGATRAVEVGTFTGYSALCIARGLAPGGRLLCCDVSEDWTAVARRAWAAAGVEDRIDLVLAPAQDTLDALPDEASLDLAFIDADKDGYVGYWEAVVRRLRPGGLVVVDNVLSHGRVLDPAATGNAAAIRRFNTHARADDRVDLVMLPIADGLTIARRRADA
jgi:caffeoyl-CoA O-methyltransferase